MKKFRFLNYNKPYKNYSKGELNLLWEERKENFINFSCSKYITCGIFRDKSFKDLVHFRYAFQNLDFTKQRYILMWICNRRNNNICTNCNDNKHLSKNHIKTCLFKSKQTFDPQKFSSRGEQRLNEIDF